MPTEAELEKAEGMTLEEIRTLALKGDVVEVVEEKKPDVKAIADAETLDNSTEAEEEAPAKTIYRKEIANDDGSVDVYEADSLEDLVEKLAEGKRQAVAQMKRVQAEKKVEDTRTAQQKADDEYVIAERLKKEPSKAIRDVVSEVIAEREAISQRAIAAQNRFVNTHPDYLANTVNGERLTKEVQNLGYTEFTVEGLEKAYQNLKRDGLLQLKSEEASATTEAEGEEVPRTVETKPEVTQPRSPKKSSTISTKNSRLTATKVQTAGFNEDEAYNLPLDKIRELANKQLADALASGGE